MVNEIEEPTQAPPPNIDAPPTDGVTDTDMGDMPPPTNVQGQADPAVGSVSTTEAASAPIAGAPPVAGTPPVTEPQPTPEVPSGPSMAEIQQLQRQAAEYEGLRAKAALQQEATKYQSQLENQGYMPEQAQQAAQQYMQSRQAQANLMKRADEYGQHLVGKQAAAEHFAQKHSLTMADLPTLRQAESPEIMEQLAKNMAERRSVDDELAKLRQAQVPAQSFDNSQGTPDVAPNDNGWLDRYNTGDRSAHANAAARRAAGLS